MIEPARELRSRGGQVLPEGAVGKLSLDPRPGAEYPLPAAPLLVLGSRATRCYFAVGCKCRRPQNLPQKWKSFQRGSPRTEGWIA